MKVTKQIKISHHDTDCYAVVWHGSFIKYFEEGRCDYCEKAGINLSEYESSGMLFPVADLYVKYKTPAKIYDIVEIETSTEEVRRASVIFLHTVKNVKTGATVVEAKVTITFLKDGKLSRMPDNLAEAFRQSEAD